MKKNCSFFKAAPYCLALKIFPFFLLSVFLFSNITVQAQVNAYARVTSISGLRLNLSNVNQDSDTFQNGDQIIVMQMQDDVIGGNTGNNANFGNLSAIASAGYYEVATINSASNLPSYITITATLQHTFNTGSNSRVQIISYRKMSTSDYTTLANITALSWNGNIGGVVAMQVPGIFTLAHDITVDAQGFRGGAASADVDDDCMPDSYRSNSTNFGAKGEGIFCRTATSQTRGRAHILTGGGGGSTNNAGGGGGGNYSAGGQGGAGWTCSASPSGGIGGIGLAGSITYERIFMGGGGGGGQQNNTVGTAGSNGGGIVLIRAQTLTTNCSGTRMISANGGNAVNSGNDGAGGAGAGGTIVLSVNTFNIPDGCQLLLQSNGGNGGNVAHANSHGGGGGGGQGAIMYLQTIPGNNVTAVVNNGAGGQNFIGGPTAGSGSGPNNAGIVLGNGNPLPVNLMTFNAGRSGDHALLNWTATESRNTTFAVQHSTDGSSFQTIGYVNGISGSNVQQYRFIHPNPVEGINYYRLAMNDPSGRTNYSIVATVKFNGARQTMVAYPNPAAQQFSLMLTKNVLSIAVLNITDLNGKTVFHQNYQLNGNRLSVTLDKKLTPGIYTIQLIAGAETQYGKLNIR